MTTQLPAEKELGLLRDAVVEVNDRIERLMEQYGDTIKVTPYVNYSEGRYAEVHVDVTRVLIRI